MRLKFLLTATTALCLAWSSAVLAQDPDPKLKDKQDQGRAAPQRGPAAKAAPQRAAPTARAAPAARTAPAARAAPAAAAAPAAPRRQRQQRQGQSAAPSAVGKSGRQPTLGASAPATTARAPAASNAQARTQTTAAPRRAPAPLTGWTAPARGANRDRAAQQWRSGHRNWDSGALWRQNPNWWRNDPGFRLYNGPRINFFFIPEIGYITAPPQYYSTRWQPGGYLPNFFWRYQVRDYDRYGLPQPPYGCAWVWVNDDVVLMDTSDGYILDIVDNVW